VAPLASIVEGDVVVDSTFVLIHSPLVGPITWSLVADALRERAIEGVTPTLHDADGTGAPYWEQHAEAVARAVAHVPTDRPLVMVGHSGVGPLLPVIRRRLPHPVLAYVFVDAGLPLDGLSRLAAMGAEDPDFALELRRHLVAGGHFPDWTDEDLREAIPDDRLRRLMVTELHPRSLAFFEEPIPGFVAAPDAPCGYLRFSAAYDEPADRARRAGWAYRAFDAGHFHMLVDPPAVTDALVDLALTPPTA